MAKSLRVKAAEAGRKHYTGEPCKRNPAHGTARYTSSGQCVKCCGEVSLKRVKYIRDTLKAAVSA